MDARGYVSAARDWALPRTGRIVYGLGDAAMDRLLGVRTSGAVSLRELGFAVGSHGRYEPAPWRSLFTSLRALDASPDDVFVDLGAGKGRVMLAAMRLPFRRVIGVELSPELAAQARTAVERRRFWMRAGAAEVFEADAAAWPVPDDVTVVYMFCPFMGPVFKAVIENILDSVERRARRLRLVYLNPFEHNYLLSTGRFVPAAWSRPPRRAENHLNDDVVTYEVISSAVEHVPVGPVGEWAGIRDTSEMISGFHPMIPGRGTRTGHDG